MDTLQLKGFRCNKAHCTTSSHCNFIFNESPRFTGGRFLPECTRIVVRQDQIRQRHRKDPVSRSPIPPSLSSSFVFSETHSPSPNALIFDIRTYYAVVSFASYFTFTVQIDNAYKVRSNDARHKVSMHHAAIYKALFDSGRHFTNPPSVARRRRAAQPSFALNA